MCTTSSSVSPVSTVRYPARERELLRERPRDRNVAGVGPDECRDDVGVP
jgi:hypothetical protein